MEVFVLTTQDVIDFEDHNNVEVFSTLEDAKNELVKYASKVKQTIEDADEDWVIESSEDEFTAYQEYRYAENHCRANIVKAVVK